MIGKFLGCDMEVLAEVLLEFMVCGMEVQHTPTRRSDACRTVCLELMWWQGIGSGQGSWDDRDKGSLNDLATDVDSESLNVYRNRD